MHKICLEKDSQDANFVYLPVTRAVMSTKDSCISRDTAVGMNDVFKAQGFAMHYRAI